LSEAPSRSPHPAGGWPGLGGTAEVAVADTAAGWRHDHRKSRPLRRATTPGRRTPLPPTAGEVTEAPPDGEDLGRLRPL